MTVSSLVLIASVMTTLFFPKKPPVIYCGGAWKGERKRRPY